VEPPPVDFVAHSADGGRDEELVQPPDRPERRRRIGIATALVLLAGLAVRVLASAPDDPPRAHVAPTSSASTAPGETGELPVGAPPDVFPVDPSDIHLFPVGCNQNGRGCIVGFGVPKPFLKAVHDTFGPVRTERAATTRAATAAHGRLVGYQYLGLAAGRTISISVTPKAHKLPDFAGVRRSGTLLDAFGETSRGGYRIQVEALSPPGHAPPVRKVAALARDPRLRP
jgi:hypothetical protein